MTRLSDLERLDRAMTEAQLQACVLDLAALRGWLAYHTHDSRRSHAGFPDLTLVRVPRVVFAELKRQTGVLRYDQQRWIDALQRCGEHGAGVEAFVWRPSDWRSGQIEEVLR